MNLTLEWLLSGCMEEEEFLGKYGTFERSCWIFVSNFSFLRSHVFWVVNQVTHIFAKSDCKGFTCEFFTREDIPREEMGILAIEKAGLPYFRCK